MLLGLFLIHLTSKASAYTNRLVNFNQKNVIINNKSYEKF